jgi:predicted transcriptional regulator
MKVTEQQIIEALQSTGGFRNKASQILGISRSALSQRINNNKKLKEIADDIQESYLDIAESTIVKSIENGDTKTAQWYLERKGKERGYTKEIQEEKGDFLNLLWGE